MLEVNDVGQRTASWSEIEQMLKKFRHMANELIAEVCERWCDARIQEQRATVLDVNDISQFSIYL